MSDSRDRDEYTQCVEVLLERFGIQIPREELADVSRRLHGVDETVERLGQALAIGRPSEAS